jgi:hypothetical protein
MRRAAAAFAFVFVASLMLASYGHCWPMLAAQVATEAAPHASHHEHGGPQKQHHHPTEGFGQELSVPGVPAGPLAIVEAPVAKSFAPILLVVAVAEFANADAEVRRSHRARAGPPSFQEFHARTGRLLI